MNPMILFRQNTNPVRKLLMMKMAAGGSHLNEYTAEGNPLTFNTNVAKPLKSLLIPWTPSQSGSGDPSPENVRPISGFDGLTAYRTGTNVWDEEWVVGAILNNGAVSIDDFPSRRTSSFIPVTPNTTYYQASPDSAYAGRIAYYDANKNCTYFSSNGVPRSTKKFTTDSNTYFVRITFGGSYGTTYNNDISINYPDTDTDYHTYSGTSYPVTFPALGKNLFDPSVLSDLSSTLQYKSIYVGDNVVTVSSTAPWVDGSYANLFALPGQVTSGASSGANDVANTHSRTIVPIDGYISIAYRSMGGVNPAEYNNQIEKGNQATDYEPYTNTCYGGELDLVSGVLTVGWKEPVLSSVEWMFVSENTSRQIWGFVASDRKPVEASELPSAKCSEFTPVTQYGVWSVGKFAPSTINNKKAFIFVFEPGSYSTNAEVQQAMKDVQFVYELAEPYTIQLTPTEITSLIGDNTVWSDTNGSNTAVYYKRG